MAELTIGQLIKILLGVFVIVVVIVGLYFLFRGKILSFFKNIPGEEGAEIILSLIK